MHAGRRPGVLPPDRAHVRGSRMSRVAIRVDGLSKQYRIGRRERYKTLRDSLTDTLVAPFRWIRSPRRAVAESAADTFWALRDVSFDVPVGLVVGVLSCEGVG